MTDGNGPAGKERRVHFEAREVFVQACELLAPFFADNASNKEIASMSKFAMAHMLNDHFPGLSGQQAQIVIGAAERLHREKRLRGLTGKQSGGERL